MIPFFPAVALLGAFGPIRCSPSEVPEVHSLFGCSVAGLGDVDADGAPDFLIADPGGPGPGRVWLVSGSKGRALYARDGDAPGDDFGWDLRAVGDVDGDGIADWIAGSDGIWKLTECGESYASVHSGRDGSRLYLFRSKDPEEELGRCFSGAGDVDRDGREDLVIGSRRCGSPSDSKGIASIYAGKDGRRLQVFGRTFDAGTRAFDIASLGDCSGDEVPDILVALQSPTDEGTEVRRATLFSGANGDSLWSFHVEENHFIQRVRPAGDIDGDGYPDAFVSCRWMVFLLSGKNGSVIREFEPKVHQFRGVYPPDGPLRETEFGVALAILRKGEPGWTLAVGADRSGGALGAIYYLDVSTGARSRSFPHEVDGTLYHLGCNLDCAGDLDRDGWDDLLCGTFGLFGQADGLALVFSGKDGKELRRFARRGDDITRISR